ncbi:MAG: hypothetical protein AB1428_02860 [Bacteroidota bacterium]
MRPVPAILLACVVVCAGCDTGLSPLDEPSGFTGIIRFRNWPPPDSVRELRLVAFETYPSDSSSILLSLVSGKAVIYPPVGDSTLARFRDSITYTWTTQKSSLQVKKYDYLVVAQRYGPNFFADWKPAGVYTAGGDSFVPAPLRILLHRIVPSIDIMVDFRNPPPKPWR